MVLNVSGFTIFCSIHAGVLWTAFLKPLAGGRFSIAARLLQRDVTLAIEEDNRAVTQDSTL